MCHPLSLLFAVAVVAAATPAMALDPTTAFPITPTVNYDHPFRLYSAEYDAFCRPDCATTTCFIACDLLSSQMAEAPYFGIGGSCGPIVSSSSVPKVSIYPMPLNTTYCKSNITSAAANPARVIQCVVVPGSGCTADTAPADAQQYVFANTAFSDQLWLRGGGTPIAIRNSAVPSDPKWCGVAPSRQIECNRVTIGASETFYLVPA